MSGPLVSAVFESALPAWLKPYAAAFASFAAADGTRCYPSVARLANMVGRCERATHYAILELRRRGVLTVKTPAGRYRSTRYLFHADALPRLADPRQLPLFPLAVVRPMAARPALMGAMDCAPRVQRAAPDPSIDPSPVQYVAEKSGDRRTPKSHWQRLLAIAHSVIDDYPLEPGQWSSEMKHRCLCQGVEYAAPMTTNVPAYRRALLAAEARRGQRVASR